MDTGRHGPTNASGVEWLACGVVALAKPRADRPLRFVRTGKPGTGMSNGWRFERRDSASSNQEQRDGVSCYDFGVNSSRAHHRRPSLNTQNTYRHGARQSVTHRGGVAEDGHQAWDVCRRHQTTLGGE